MQTWGLRFPFRSSFVTRMLASSCGVSNHSTNDSIDCWSTKNIPLQKYVHVSNVYCLAMNPERDGLCSQPSRLSAAHYHKSQPPRTSWNPMLPGAITIFVRRDPANSPVSIRQHYGRIHVCLIWTESWYTCNRPSVHLISYMRDQPCGFG